MSAYQLSTAEVRGLNKAQRTVFPFAITGYLLAPVLLGSVAVGRIYGHIKADPVTGRFTDGHLMHTSSVGGFFEHEGFVVLVTRNSLYVCVVPRAAVKFWLIGQLQALPKPTFH